MVIFLLSAFGAVSVVTFSSLPFLRDDFLAGSVLGGSILGCSGIVSSTGLKVLVASACSLGLIKWPFKSASLKPSDALANF
jgi:hypothetical protein